MRPDDHDINLLRAHWAEEPLPAGLAERIIRHARSQAQWQPWYDRMALTLGDWHRAWALKGPALAAIALLGLLGGQLAQGDTATTHTTGISWTEEL